MATPRPDFQPTQPAPVSALTGQAIDEFRVGHPAEVLALLRRLVDGNVLIQLSAPGGAAYTTVLWALDAQHQRISFDADPNHPQVRPLVDAGEATAVAYLDAIKVQFDVGGLVLVHGHNASALQAMLPSVLYRFQRREYFRVKAREGALAHLRHPALPEMQLALRVLDVSIGGCALALPADVPPIAAGIRIAGARIELDPDSQAEVTLGIQHVSGGFHPGARDLRLGCSFVALAGAAERTLQRYIDLTQRRARLLSLG
jgi:c-di-GMP-binding flagellar brake protein YcgR